MFKNILLSYLFILFVLTTSGCDQNINQCNSKANCALKIEKNIDASNFKRAIVLYEQFKSFNEGQENFSILNSMAVQNLKDIYKGKIDFGKKIGFLQFADQFYTKSGLPVVSEKIGVKDVVQKVEYRKKLAKIISALGLFYAGDSEYLDNTLTMMDDPEPSVRGVLAACLSRTQNERYLPQLQQIYETDKKAFVRTYALRGLALIDYSSYKEEVQRAINSEDPLEQTIAAGIMLKHGDESVKSIIIKSLHADDSILNIRAMEALMLNQTILEEDRIKSFLNVEEMVQRMAAAQTLGVAGNPKYIDFLKNKLIDPNYKDKFSISLGLFEARDLTGLDTIIDAMASPNYNERLFGCHAIINYHNK
jgi:hypothetical protein